MSHLTFDCSVSEPFSESDKKYITIELYDKILEKVIRFHQTNQKSVKHLVDPLQDGSLLVKVPFRYNRVMCEVSGRKTVQELVKGDKVIVTIKYCGWWESNGYGGPTWKLESVGLVSACIESDTQERIFHPWGLRGKSHVSWLTQQSSTNE